MTKKCLAGNESSTAAVGCAMHELTLSRLGRYAQLEKDHAGAAVCFLPAVSPIDTRLI